MDKNISLKTKYWIAAVADGSLTMSQRKVDALVRLEGSLEPVILEARKAGIHLLQLTDDKGNVLLAASREPFKVLC